VLAMACAISLAIRLSKPAWVSVYPLFFIADFCFGMAFAYGRKDAFMLSPLMLALSGPVMALPYVVFTLFSFIPNMRILGVASFIGRHTFEIFLFHESLMKVSLGKWKVLGMDAIGSTAVLVVCLGTVALAAGPIANALKKSDGLDVQRQV
jgi:peptidoglycan/LPS O-acetylase OafA/YrhL